MNKYISMTIGPIIDTINLAPSPAALWTASYMFSSLTKTICKMIINDEVPAENIISPYYDESLEKNDGIGLFHDRVIVCVDETDFNEDKLSVIKKEAVKEISKKFGIDENYLLQYIMIASVSYESDHAIKGCGKILDCLELAKPFVQKDDNKIFSLFVNEGKSEKANEAIKNLPIIKEIGDNWPLYKSDKKTIKSLPDIAHADTETVHVLKKNDYYAIVRADGDNMSDVFGALIDNEEIRGYSKSCMNYCRKVSDLVKAYGGVTIYSGGDDLLALLPLEKASVSECEQTNLFSFLSKANEIMNDVFEGFFETIKEKRSKNDGKKFEAAIPTLSFGVTVSYVKYPLYEALKDSKYLLFGVAKKYKNCTALRVQKHAGQSEGLIIPNQALAEIIKLKKTLDENVSRIDAEKTDKIFLSALHKLSLFESFFERASDKAQVENLFNNLFDAEAHENNTFLKRTLPEYFCGIKDKKTEYYFYLIPEYLRTYLQDRGIKPNDENMELPYPVPSLVYLLRILKLYYEKAGERYENV